MVAKLYNHFFEIKFLIAYIMATKKISERAQFLIDMGQHIKKIREEKGISLREMELRGDLDRHVLSKIENGKLNTGIYSLKKICDLLEINLEDLFKGFNKKN